MQYWLIVAFTLGGGTFSMVCAWQDFDFFMDHRKARLFIRLFGRQGTRIIYGVIGAGLAIGGAVLLMTGPV